MGGGGAPAAPQPVAVPSAADEEAAEERARLYSLLRSRRAGRTLSWGPRRSLLSATSKVPPMPILQALSPALLEGGGGNPGGYGAGEPGSTGGMGGGMGDPSGSTSGQSDTSSSESGNAW